MLKKLLAVLMLVSSQFLMAFTIENGMIKDSKGNSIEIKEYNRVVILDPAVIETFYMIGAEDKIAAIGTTARSKIYPEEKVKNLPSVGNIVNISLEKVLSFSPDLVILSVMSSNTGESLKALKIPMITSEAGNFDEILENIKLCGELTGKREEAEKLYKASVEKLENLKKNTRENPLNLKGTVLYSTSPMMAFNSKSLPGQILNTLGVDNITDNLVGDRPILSPEFLLKENPDFLVGAMSIRTPEDILNSNPMIKEINAGKNNNIFIVDSTKILRGSPRIFEAMEEFYSELQKVKK